MLAPSAPAYAPTLSAERLGCQGLGYDARMVQVAAAIVIAFAGIGAGYAFRDSTIRFSGDRPMSFLVAGQGAFLGALAGAAVAAIAAGAAAVL